MARAARADAAAAARAPHVRGRDPRDRRCHPRALQHLSRRRRRPPPAVRSAIPAIRQVASGMNLRELNALDSNAAMRQFLRCCGSRRWADAMTAARPFAGVDAMNAAADTIWSSLERSDWLEAFAAHPRIGSGGPDGSGGSDGDENTTWSAAEQAGMSSATTDVRERLVEANREYEARFGFIFIVCATGRR